MGSLASTITERVQKNCFSNSPAVLKMHISAGGVNHEHFKF